MFSQRKGGVTFHSSFCSSNERQLQEEWNNSKVWGADKIYVRHTYSERPLRQTCSRFAVPEKTGDNVHYFLFKKDNKGNAVLQYKMKRYSFAMWPRKYHEGQSYEHAEYGFGTVCRCEPFKDPISKQKYWKNTVQFTREDGSSYETVFKTNAAKYPILAFPSFANGERSLPLDFPPASFDGTFSKY